MDIAIGDIILLNKMRPGPIDPYSQESIDSSFTREIKLPCKLPPLTRCLLVTAESFTMPIHKLGLAQLRSSWAMLGLIIPPTIIDPGFYGHLTIEVFNSAPMPIILRPGDVVFSIAIVNAEDVPIYNGKYQGQIGIRKPVALKRT